MKQRVICQQYQRGWEDTHWLPGMFFIAYITWQIKIFHYCLGFKVNINIMHYIGRRIKSGLSLKIHIKYMWPASYDSRSQPYAYDICMQHSIYRNILIFFKEYLYGSHFFFKIMWNYINIPILAQKWNKIYYTDTKSY